MLRQLFFPGLLDTGAVRGPVLAMRDIFVNLYVVKAPAGLVCIDTGWSPSRITRGFESLGLDPRDVAAVFLTHGHWDHARCMQLYPHAEIFVGDRENVKHLTGWRRPSQTLLTVGDGQTVMAAGLSVQVVATPGHTPGAVSLVVGERFLFVGDALRLREGRVLPFHSIFNSDSKAGIRSIQKLAGIDGIDCLLTAHTGVSNEPADAFRQWRGQQEGLS